MLELDEWSARVVEFLECSASDDGIFGVSFQRLSHGIHFYTRSTVEAVSTDFLVNLPSTIVVLSHLHSIGIDVHSFHSLHNQPYMVSMSLPRLQTFKVPLPLLLVGI